MGKARYQGALYYALVLTVASVVSTSTFIQTCQALTASYGRPYQGHLENGVVFPNQFPGYHLRDENRSYTTPEVVGALLDAIEGVRTQFPGTCDVFLADFSIAGGGSAIHHRSHQNGRDVDVGMYAKGNRPLGSLVPMSEENLDAAKTWCLIEGLIASQRVQYIFLDRSVQKVLYEYARTKGYDDAYLSRVFGNVRGALIQHVKNHVDHMHVRFFTPWSTLAAHIGADESEKQAVIEAAQQSYLPSKVNYYVNGSEKGIDELAHSFGVTTSDLCKWNHISQSSVLVPGSCLVFYKRSFESEPVLLARSLQPGFIAQAQPVRTAALQTEPAPSTITDSTFSDDAEHEAKLKQSEEAVSSTSAPGIYKARRGDTLARIARRNNLDVKLLCQLNGIKKSARLKPGQAVKTSAADMYAADNAASDSSEDEGDAHLKSGSETTPSDSSHSTTADQHKKKSSPSSICFASDSKKPDSPTAAYFTVNNGGTLKSISKKTGIPLSSLCQLNGLSRNAHLKPGQRIKLTQANLPVTPSLGSAACSIKDSAKKTATGNSDKKSSRQSVVKGAHGAATKSPGKAALAEKSKSTAAKTAAGKPALKQTGKSGKISQAAVQKKISDTKEGSAKSKARAKRATLAKR